MTKWNLRDIRMIFLFLINMYFVFYTLSFTHHLSSLFKDYNGTPVFKVLPSKSISTVAALCLFVLIYVSITSMK